ncbi:MAG: hypothetical protein JNM82_08900 [Rhodocyclaceae bacterium]|nr:hypothetical protein [Rhodocyclaceae bacterium]
MRGRRARRPLGILLAAGLLALPGAVLPEAVGPLGALAFLRAYPVEPASDEAPAPAPPRREEHAARRALSGGGFHDPANPDLKYLQRHDEAVAGLPKDANGFPDWMRALREGRIRPRGSLRGDGDPEVLDLDVIMRNTKDMPPVRFPHRAHTLWLACANCHPTPFEARAGANRIAMADIFRGQYCGVCHDRVAFITFYSCNRCHSVGTGG